MKKKLLSTLLVLSMLLTAVVIAVPAGAASFLRGDIDGDGELTPMDALELTKYLANVTNWIELDLADVDGDGEILAMDSLMLKLHLAGAIDITEKYPVPDTNVGTITIARQYCVCGRRTAKIRKGSLRQNPAHCFGCLL